MATVVRVHACARLLVQDPNYDFMPLYVSKPAADLSAGLTDGDLIIYRRRLDPIDNYRSQLVGGASNDIAFGVPNLRLREARGVYELDCTDFDAVARATAACHPIIQQTAITGPGGVRAVIECPVCNAAKRPTPLG